MKSWLSKLLNNLRTSLWFIPTLMVVGAALLSLLTQYVDTTLVGHEMPRWIEVFTYAGEPDGARTILGAIAGSMITVAGTVFSITIVALSLASSQFGPRLLRNFLSDRGNQAVLGTFVATFLFCILVMRQVYGETSASRPDVPAVSVSMAIALGVVSLGVLIYFIHHIAQSMQAEHIVSTVYEELQAQVAHMFPEKTGTPADTQTRKPEETDIEAALDREGQLLVSNGSGYIQAVDADSLLGLAQQHQLVIRLALRPGDFVLPEAALVFVLPRLDEQQTKDLTLKVRECFALDMCRTPHQNIEFGIDQIVEVAVRALSPGINDPFTAMTCIDRLGAVLSLLTNRTIPSPYRTCSSGKIRLIIPPVSYRSLVERAFSQIRQNARTVPSVIIRLTETIARVGERESISRRRILLRQVMAIAEHSNALDSTCDRKDLEERIQGTRHVLERDQNDPPQSSREAVERYRRRIEELRVESKD